MATIYDVCRRIDMRINERAQDFISGGWMNIDQSPEWHGMRALSEIATIAGLKEALDLIAELQKDN